MRYGTVNPVHVAVELLNQHKRTSDELVTKRLPFPTVNDSGKLSVSKMTQNDSALRMNASSGKVLRKCLVGIIITEPERERCMIKRGRKKETIRKVPKQFTIVRICEKKYICMENA